MSDRSSPSAARQQDQDDFVLSALSQYWTVSMTDTGKGPAWTFFNGRNSISSPLASLHDCLRASEHMQENGRFTLVSPHVAPVDAGLAETAVNAVRQGWSVRRHPPRGHGGDDWLFVSPDRQTAITKGVNTHADLGNLEDMLKAAGYVPPAVAQAFPRLRPVPPPQARTARRPRTAPRAGQQASKRRKGNQQ